MNTVIFCALENGQVVGEILSWHQCVFLLSGLSIISNRVKIELKFSIFTNDIKAFLNNFVYMLHYALLANHPNINN